MEEIQKEFYDKFANPNNLELIEKYLSWFEKKRKKELEEVVSEIELIQKELFDAFESQDNGFKNIRSMGYNDALSDCSSIIKSKINPPTQV